MFRQLNFRSFFNFLGRNKLYAAINIFGLSVSLMFVILIADYTLRQLTCDDYHAKADRIYVIGNEERITSGYYLQKYLRDRYPEIESTCAVAVSGQSTDATQPVEVGLQKYSATILFADTTFFRIFDYQLLDGDREQVLASRDNVVLSESFARKVFRHVQPDGAGDPLPRRGEVVRCERRGAGYRPLGDSQYGHHHAGRAPLRYQFGQ